MTPGSKASSPSAGFDLRAGQSQPLVDQGEVQQAPGVRDRRLQACWRHVRLDPRWLSSRDGGSVTPAKCAQGSRRTRAPRCSRYLGTTRSRSVPFVNLPNSIGKSHWGEGITAEDMAALRWVQATRRRRGRLRRVDRRRRTCVTPHLSELGTTRLPPKCAAWMKKQKPIR